MQTLPDWPVPPCCTRPPEAVSVFVFLQRGVPPQCRRNHFYISLLHSFLPMQYEEKDAGNINAYSAPPDCGSAAAMNCGAAR
jgi:hypothetical protein